LINTKENGPFIIAELSGNHNQSLDQALTLVDKAAEAGVDAVKLQTYTPDTMTIDLNDNEFFINNKDNLWKGKSLYNLYKTAYTPWHWHEEIFNRCKKHNMVAFSSPFDETAVDFLESLNVPYYKIASFENVDLPLIKKVAKTGKPVIISSGMASVSELDEAVRTARDNGAKEIHLLKCTTTYPAPPEHSNLKTIPHIKEMFKCEVGLSDHTLGIGVAVASVALGASIIEKHFTLSRQEGGVDSSFSLEPEEMKQLVYECRNAWKSLGEIHYGPTEKEETSKKRRRSLYVTKDLGEGEILTTDNLRAIRPGLGLPPKYIDALIGKKVNRPVKKGTPMSWDLI